MKPSAWALVVLAVLSTGAGAQAPAAARAEREPLMADVPNACAYLSERLASEWLRAPVTASAANEHIPTFSSQCAWSGRGVRNRHAGFVFKYMVWEMFDVEGLPPEQIKFNVSFAVGNLPLVQTLPEPGKGAFVFHSRDATVLLVVTGFRGPPDGAKRPQAFVATYRLSDPQTAHDLRLAKLMEQAQRHVREWRGRP